MEVITDKMLHFVVLQDDEYIIQIYNQLISLFYNDISNFLSQVVKQGSFCSTQWIAIPRFSTWFEPLLRHAIKVKYVSDRIVFTARMNPK